jgi:hypothetical protein
MGLRAIFTASSGKTSRSTPVAFLTGTSNAAPALPDRTAVNFVAYQKPEFATPQNFI